MRFWVNSPRTTALTTDHRLAHYNDKNLDHTHTDQILKTTCTNWKYCKKWVGHRTCAVRTENVGCGCVSMHIQPFIVSVHRAGTRKQAIGRGERPLTLIHHRCSFRQIEKCVHMQDWCVGVPQYVYADSVWVLVSYLHMLQVSRQVTVKKRKLEWV